MQELVGNISQSHLDVEMSRSLFRPHSVSSATQKESKLLMKHLEVAQKLCDGERGPKSRPKCFAAAWSRARPNTDFPEAL